LREESKAVRERAIQRRRGENRPVSADNRPILPINRPAQRQGGRRTESAATVKKSAGLHR
jgi:hypothetical protein